MNKRNVFRNLGTALIFVPLLACGTDGAGGGTGDGTIPTCGTGQALSTNAKGQLICKDLPKGTVSLPSCMTGQALTGNDKGVSCTNLNDGGQDDPAIVTRIDKAESSITMQETKISMLANRPASIRTYVGNTTASFNGNFVAAAAGSDNGFVGAAKVCENQYGMGARMCTAEEIYFSAVKGAISSTKNITKAWVYFPAWNNPIAGSLDPLQGAGDTCGSLTYPTGDLKWTGVAVSTGALRTTRWGVRLHGGSEAPCNAPLPISCCK